MKTQKYIEHIEKSINVNKQQKKKIQTPKANKDSCCKHCQPFLKF